MTGVGRKTVELKNVGRGEKSFALTGPAMTGVGRKTVELKNVGRSERLFALVVLEMTGAVLPRGIQS
jgi:hypothetical protein